MFRYLQPALEKSNPYVFAQDISSSGCKQFWTGTLELFKNIYADNSVSRHWYECLLENRPTRLFLDIESMTEVSITDIVDFFKKSIQSFCEKRGIYNNQFEIEILDSCSTTKYSWHVLFKNVIFKNIYHVGAFVRRTILAMQDNPLYKAVDTAIYTKNRMFRLAGSSKFGSNRILRTSKPWWELLVQIPSEKYFECLEIDGSEPASTSIHPHALFTYTRDRWIRNGSPVQCDAVHIECPLLTPVLDWLDHHEKSEIMRHKIKLIETGCFMVPAKSRTCHIAKRTHKGNKIWYLIDLTKMEITQRCTDAECGRQKYKIQHPLRIWNRWTSAWSNIEPTQNNQKTLFNISY